MSTPNQAIQKRSELKELLDGRYKTRIEGILRERAPQFAAALVQVVNRSWMLQKCKPESVIGAAITAAALDLSIEPALGEAHLVPYKEQCVFQIGYRGITQLALRSGQYKRMGNCGVREGQLKKWNKLTGELEIDFSVNQDKPVIGYAAWFQLVNGFERGNYWTENECMEHAARFSASFKGPKKQESPWVTHKEKMCLKTVWIDLVRPWGPKSIQMQDALARDNTTRATPDVEPAAFDIEAEPLDESGGDGAEPVAPDAHTSAPTEQTTIAAMPPNGLTAQQRLEHLICKDFGSNFPTFIKFAERERQLKDADSIPDWNAIPEADAKRLLRWPKDKLKEGLEKI